MIYEKGINSASNCSAFFFIISFRTDVLFLNMQIIFSSNHETRGYGPLMIDTESIKSLKYDVDRSDYFDVSWGDEI